MGLLVLLGAVAGAALLGRTDKMTREMTDNILPARVAAADLQAALRDQETGLRGYLISADRQFLAPYYDGEHDELASAGEVRRRIGSHPDLIADLDAIEKASASWRATYADPLIASVAPNAPNVVTSATAERGKAEFDHIRDLFTVQNDDLATARAHAANELQRVDDWRDRLLIAMVVVFCATATFLGLLTRYAVTLPLQSLAAACRRITQGHFGEAITPPRRPTRHSTYGAGRGRHAAADGGRARGVAVGADAAGRAGGRIAPLQRRTRAVRLRRVARSAGALTQGRLVLSAAREAIRRQARRARCRIHRFRGGRRQAYAGAHQRSTQLLPGRPGGRHHAEADLETALDDALANLATAIEESDADDRAPGAAASAGRRGPHPADDVVAEPDWQRGEVPAPRSSAPNRHRMSTSAPASGY